MKYIDGNFSGFLDVRVPEKEEVKKGTLQPGVILHYGKRPANQGHSPVEYGSGSSKPGVQAEPKVPKKEQTAEKKITSTQSN